MSIRASDGDIVRRGAGSRLVCGAAAAGTAAAAYMVFEAQWVRRRRADLSVPGLPAPLAGLTILHLSDAHAGSFFVNEVSLAKAVRWAAPLAPDLVLLTGDMLGDPDRSRRGLRLLEQLAPRLGMFAVTGNHEYGLGKGPFARPRDTRGLWAEAGVTLLVDDCVTVPVAEGFSLVLCGADYLTGGDGLYADGATALPQRGHPGSFPVLLIHKPPALDSPLADVFPLAFAGHTHGGQMRLPTPSGLRPLNGERLKCLDGVCPWGAGLGEGLLVVSRGVGASFLPFRLFTRPEATLWRLVYTSGSHSAATDDGTDTGGTDG